MFDNEVINLPNAGIEKFCNEVAAQILLPHESLADYWQEFSGDTGEKINRIHKKPAPAPPP